MLAFVEAGGEGGFAAGEGEFGDGLFADGVELDAGGVEGVGVDGGNGEGAAEEALAGVVEELGGGAAEGLLAGLVGGNAFVEEFGEAGEVFAVAGLGVEKMDDGPALGVEEAGAVGFVVDGGVFGDGEELAGREPVELAEDADVVVDGAADEPAVFFGGDGGVELGDALFEPEGAAGGGVFEGGVDEFVGEGAEVVGAGEYGEVVAFGAGLVEAAGGGDGAEVAEPAVVGEEIGADFGLAATEEALHLLQAGEGAAGGGFAGVGDDFECFRL